MKCNHCGSLQSFRLRAITPIKQGFSPVSAAVKFTNMHTALTDQGGTPNFSSYEGSGPASTVHPQNISGSSNTPKKIFEILATPKNIPHSVPWLSERTLKCIEMTPKYSPILWWPPKNIHEVLIPQKYLFFRKPPKILKFKFLSPKKWPEPMYVWKYHSTPHGVDTHTLKA